MAKRNANNRPYKPYDPFPSQLDVEEIQFDSVRPPPALEYAIENLGYYSRLRSLRFMHHITVTPTLMEHVLSLPRINRLAFDDCPTPTCFDVIWRLGTNLTHLELVPGPPLTVQNASGLLTLSKIRTLKISLAQTDEGIPVLIQSTSLTSLEVRNFWFRSNHLRMLLTMPSLRSLRLNTPTEAFFDCLDELACARIYALFIAVQPNQKKNHELIKALGRNKHIQILGLVTQMNNCSCLPLAENQSLTHLDISNHRWSDPECFLRNSTLTHLTMSLGERERHPNVTTHIAKNYERLTEWIRHDFLTSVLALASLRDCKAKSPWQALPLDIIRIIFAKLRQPGKTEDQIIDLVEFVWQNIGEMSESLRKTRHGIRVIEAVVRPKSRFRWEPALALTNQLPSLRKEESCVVH